MTLRGQTRRQPAAPPVTAPVDTTYYNPYTELPPAGLAEAPATGGYTPEQQAIIDARTPPPSPDTGSTDTPQSNPMQDFLNALMSALGGGGGGGGGSSGPSQDQIANTQLRADLLRNTQWGEGQQFQDYLSQLGLKKGSLEEQLGFLPGIQSRERENMQGQLAAQGSFTNPGAQRQYSDALIQQHMQALGLQNNLTGLGLTQKSAQTSEDLYQNQLANQLQSIINSWGQYGVH